VTDRDPFHAQTTVTLGVERVAVDEGIAALVVALWRAGFCTVSSCQNMGEAYRDTPPVAMVAFEGRTDAQRFARLVGTGAQVVEITAENQAKATKDTSGLPVGTPAVGFPPSDIGCTLARHVALDKVVAQGCRDPTKATSSAALIRLAGWRSAEPMRCARRASSRAPSTTPATPMRR
jgi:hypothetical protein